MELNQNSPSYEFRLVQAILANIRTWQIEIFHIARYPTGEGREVQNYRAMHQETNTVDPLIFQNITKIP